LREEIMSKYSIAMLAALLLVGLTASLGRAEEFAYVGTKNCKKCHLKEYNSWAKTKMGMAFDSLKPGADKEAKVAAGLDGDKDYTKDASCVGCHTTGYGKPGGFVDMETTPDLANVGCESCHGPGGTYTKDQYMSFKNKTFKSEELAKVGFVAKPGAEQCQDCHNDKNPLAPKGYTFDYDAIKDKGIHEHIPMKYEH